MTCFIPIHVFAQMIDAPIAIPVIPFPTFANPFTTFDKFLLVFVLIL